MVIDKNLIMNGLVVAFGGMVVLNIQRIIQFISNHVLNNLVYSIKIEDSSSFYYAMQKYVNGEQDNRIKNFYYKNFWDNFVSNVDKDNRKKSDNLFFGYGYFLLKHNGYRIFLSKSTTQLTNSFDPWKQTKQSINLYAFNSKAIFSLLNYIEDKYHKDTINYYFNSDGETKILGVINNKKFDHIFLNDNMVDTIKNDVDKFLTNKDKYRQLGIKYKRTYLFYGPAGTGKSSLATAIANHTSRNILNINLSKEMTDATLIKVISGRPDNCIILFEDIDCLFSNLKREEDKVEKKDDKEKDCSNKVTLSCLLNILDGSYTPDNVIFILTTNHIDKLDDAIRRDGRTDVKLEISKPNKDTIKRYMEYVSKVIGKNVDGEINEGVSLATLEKYLL
jgi:ATP-dependent Zn protease